MRKIGLSKNRDTSGQGRPKENKNWNCYGGRLLNLISYRGIQRQGGEREKQNQEEQNSSEPRQTGFRLHQRQTIIAFRCFTGFGVWGNEKEKEEADKGWTTKGESEAGIIWPSIMSHDCELGKASGRRISRDTQKVPTLVSLPFFFPMPLFMYSSRWSLWIDLLVIWILVFIMQDASFAFPLHAFNPNQHLWLMLPFHSFAYFRSDQSTIIALLFFAFLIRNTQESETPTTYPYLAKFVKYLIMFRDSIISAFV